MDDAPLLPSEVARYLTTRVLGRRLFYYPETDSTNDVAVALARGGEGEGTVVYADFQRRGRGRRTHTWSSAPRQDLLFTVILRPRGSPADVLPVTLAASIALSVVLTGAAGETVGVKWPNDLMAGAGKIGGILAESAAGDDGERFVALGVGINVNSMPADFPEEIHGRAASCRSLCGDAHDRALLFADALAAVETYYTRFSKDGFGPLAPSYDERLVLRARRVRVVGAGDVFEGSVIGVRTDGSLRVSLDSGGEAWLYSESVEVIE
jgi:BirA family biotin operon repressor/biotin-[acetyl-CoA-carboxylase] ligase